MAVMFTRSTEPRRTTAVAGVTTGVTEFLERTPALRAGPVEPAVRCAYGPASLRPCGPASPRPCEPSALRASDSAERAEHLGVERGVGVAALRLAVAQGEVGDRELVHPEFAVLRELVDQLLGATDQ